METLRERDLLQSWLAAIVESSDDAIISKTLEGIITSWNRGAEALFGYSAAEAVGRSITLIIPEDRLAEETDVLARLRRGEKIDHFETVRQAKDGRLLDLSITVSPIRDGSGAIVGASKVARDITERKRNEIELRAEMARRQRADEERLQARQDLLRMQGELAHVARVTTIGELTASIAHEVNQPLTGIATNAHTCLRWLSATPPNLEEVRNGLTRILRDGKRADDVIRRVRALLRRESPQAGPQDVNSLVREVLALLGDPLRSHDIGTKEELTTGLPPVMGDRVQLQQVVLNVVLNAIDAMSAVAGRPRTLVVASRREDDDGVEVTVRDSGVGVDAANANRLFDPFFTTKPEGMGMGLSVSRKIVESFGGRLWASANEGPGTTFHFTLRAAAAALSAP